MTPSRPPGRRPRSRARSQWRLLGSLVLGLLTVFYGLLVMSLRPAALATIAVYAGIAFIVGGVVQLGLAGGMERSWRWLAYLGGLVGIAAGIARSPGQGSP